MINDASIEFCPLGIRQWNSRAIRCDAVPDLLHEVQPILNRKAVDAE
jgi:hypothetical protein